MRSAETLDFQICLHSPLATCSPPSSYPPPAAASSPSLLPPSPPKISAISSGKIPDEFTGAGAIGSVCQVILRSSARRSPTSPRSPGLTLRFIAPSLPLPPFPSTIPPPPPPPSCLPHPRRRSPPSRPERSRTSSLGPAPARSAASARRSLIQLRLFGLIDICTAGCPFGEGCHFPHYVPGGFNAVAQKGNLGNLAPPPRNPMVSASPPGATSVPTTKTHMCNKFNTAEGCRFGDKCHFAHGEREMGKPIMPSYDDVPLGFPAGGRLAGRLEQPPPAAASFGVPAIAKTSIDGYLTGAIIGKGGVNTKQIHRINGAKLYIKDYESDATQ